MQPEARHVHPDQATRNGSMYNDNYSIPNSAAVWNFRNSIWSDKYNMAVFQNADQDGFCHKGSNAPEFYHRDSTQSFLYLNKEMVFVHGMPVIDALQKLSHYWKRAQLITIKRRQQAMKYDPENFHINDEIYHRLEKLIGLDLLREKYRDHDTGHNHLYFENTPKTVDDFLYGFLWQNSVSRITRLRYQDKKAIWKYIDQYQYQLEQNNGKITDDDSLQWVIERLHFKLTLTKLKMLIYKYYIIDDDLLDDVIQELQIDESDDFEREGEEKAPNLDQFDTSPAQNKKHSEFSYIIYIYIL